MTEHFPGSSEVALSPRQQALAELARSLTLLPGAAIRESRISRPATRRQTVGAALGRASWQK